MTEQVEQPKQGFWATAGVLGALLASSCCIFPLMFVMIGVSGAWIGNLTMLEPYKWLFIAIAALSLSIGFYQVYFRKQPDCEDGSICARPETGRITRAALWTGAVLIVLAATIDWWAPLFY